MTDASSSAGAALEPRSFASYTSSQLWRYITRTDTNVVVGLKSPGDARGVENGRVVIDVASWQNARNALLGVEGAQLISEGHTLPALRLKVISVETLEHIRQLPFTDYAEPAILVNPSGMNYLGSDGCWSSSSPPSTGPYEYFDGDILPSVYHNMEIPKAWSRTAGSGVTIGIIDTGVDPYNLELNDFFSHGMSTGRTYTYLATDTSPLAPPDWEDNCGHGTHVAGVIAAPKNANSIIGIAWKSSIVAVRHHSDVWNFAGDAFKAAQAVDLAAGTYGARIISMSFGSSDNGNYLRDMIQYWYARNTLFVGAAGTSGGIGTCPNPDLVMFPANQPEVIAVTDAKPDGSPDCKAHVGPKVELAAVAGMPTTGWMAVEGDIGWTDKSSNAAAIVAAVAALVWSQNPTCSNVCVRAKLKAGGKLYPSKSTETGYGIINAWQAIGGLNHVDMLGEFQVYPSTATNYTYTAVPRWGFGPLSYQWTASPGVTLSGVNTATVTARVGPEDEPDFTLTVRVTDQSDGTIVSRTRLIGVHPNCTDPKTCDM